MPEDYRQLKEAIEAAGLGHWRFNPETGELHSSERCKRNFGRDPAEEFTYDDLIASIHPEDRAGMQEAVRCAMNREEDYEAEYRCIWPSGEVRRVLAHGRLVEAPEEASEEASNGHAQLVGTTIDITGGKQYQKEPRGSEWRLHLASEGAGLGVFEWDPVGDRVWWQNERMYEILGQTQREGPINAATFLEEVVYSNDAERFEAAMEDALHSGWLAFTGRFWRADGDLRWIEFTGQLERGTDGTPLRVSGIAADITERKLEGQRRAFLVALSDAIGPLAKTSEVKQTAMRLLGEHLDVTLAYYFEVDEDGDTATSVAGHERGQISLPQRFRISDFGEYISRGFAAGRTLAFEDIGADPNLTEPEQASFRTLGIGAGVGVPLLKNGRLIAVLGVHDPVARRWQDAELLLLEEVAERTRAAAERARAEETLRKSEQRLSAIFSQAAVGMSEISPEGRFLRVNDELCQILGRSREDLLQRTVPEVTHPEDADETLAAFKHTLQTGEPVYVDKRYERPDGEVVHANSRLALLDDGRAGAPTVLAVTVDLTERKRAEAEREQARQQTAFLSEASRRLAESLDWQQTLSEIARLAVPGICDLCIVDTLGAPGESESVRRLAAAHHDPEKERLAWELEERYPVSEDSKSAVAEVIRTAEPVLLTEVTEDWLQYVSQDEGQRQLLEELELISMIIVPLAIHGHTFGALTLACDGSGRRYDEEDLTLASDLARRAAQAMDNARLYEEQSHAAQILQQSLLPPSLPEIPGVEAAVRFKPAASAGGRATGGYDVGGDFYDLFQTPTGWAVVVGDVAGKGVEAAQLTSMARYTLRASAMDGESPSNTVSKLNTAMLNQRSDSKFCTLAYGLLNYFDGDSRDGDSRDGGAAGRVRRLRLCRGGHPPPLILRADGTVEEAGLTGKLVGAIQQASFEDLDVDLGSGDAVIFYTDGVTEARDPEGKLFGHERLKALAGACKDLDAEEIADTLEDGIVEFQNGAPARDDVAILVLKTS